MTVDDISAKAPAVAASAVHMRQRFMVEEHQRAGHECNDGNHQFLAHDIPLLSQRRIALDSSVVHLRAAIFPISAVHHVHLLLGWWARTPRSPRRQAWKGLYSPHAITGLVTLLCSADRLRVCCKPSAGLHRSPN